MKRIFIIAIVLVALILLANYLSGDVTLDAGDNGRQIELDKGQLLVIALEANSEAGYTWEVAELDEQIMSTRARTFQRESNTNSIKIIQTLRFEAINEGKTPLQLNYDRYHHAWTEPDKTFSIQIVVR